MELFRKLPGYRRAQSGFEWVLFRRLPWIALAGTVLAVAVPGVAWLALPAAVDPLSDPLLMRLVYIMIGAVVVHWAAVGTLAIGCIIIMVMKGPAYVADAYPLGDREAPAPPIVTRPGARPD